VRQAPSVNAGPDKTIVDGDIVTLDGSGVSSITSIAWTPGTNLTGANTFTPLAKPVTTTTYTLTVTDNNSCVASDNVVITVIPYCVKVMKAFTPNGDGINDKWLVTNGASCSKQIIAKVFNRYGELVYSNEYYNNDWDGKYKGKPVADGTYYFVLQYRLINGNSIPVQGDVTILR
jgi:gliding motility-associated-like protein